MSSSRESDLNVLTEGLAHRTFQGDEQILDTPEFPAEVYILIGGSATLAAETPFGPHPVARLEAPVVVNLRRAFGGAPGLTRLQPAPGAAAAVLPSGEAHALLFDPSPRGQAFRRLALASIVTHVRETNDAMTKFFDSLTSRVKDTVRDSGEFKAAGKAVEIDLAKVYDLFDAAGLNPSGLPDLGLQARHLDATEVLVKAGTTGDAAFLLAEGRLRVSIRIPGVGEEALAILNAGEIVGEMALIDDAPRSADVFAHEGPALVYVLSRHVFRKLLETGDPAGAPLLAGITIALSRRHEEAIHKAAAFRVIAGPF